MSEQNDKLIEDIKTVINEQPAAVREDIDTAYNELKSIVKQYGGAGLMALALLGAEESA